jgi:pantothenate kinase
LIKELYDDKKAVWEWLRNAPPSYVRWLNSMQDQELRNLKSTNEPISVYRSQGRVEVLSRLLNLEQELLKETK